MHDDHECEHVHVHHHVDGQTLELFKLFFHKQDQLIHEVMKMSQATDALVAEVAAEKTILDSAAAAISGFPAVVAAAVAKALADAGVGQAATDAAVAQATTDMQADIAPLQAALTAGTQPTP
jgi:hypothetical protein